MFTLISTRMSSAIFPVFNVYGVSLIMVFISTHLCEATRYPTKLHRRYSIQEADAEGDPHKYDRGLLYSRSLPDHNQYSSLNQFHQINQLHQQNQLNQLQQLSNQQNDQHFNAQQGTQQQYLDALQQYYTVSRKQPSQSELSSQLTSASPYNQAPSSQYQQSPLTHQSQQNYHQSPLGVLYSAASDVSQFHFSGNGVNYSF